ncbi:hypothetical protein DFH08DRAFT_964261 [Mycena albidolilacea]|uniref:Uncharacterized protein n=1 Tax=Mycena albidolilacea TaxID=1033008 RepID=A0AAD6ZTR7_9AGAR|nr:hypothetical protein DFH08DRAFT_964261 [Mycena albidolilacea]
MDIGILGHYLHRTAQNPGLDTSTTRPSSFPDLIRVKIEATPPSVTPGSAVMVKVEPQSISVPPNSNIKMRALNEDGRKVFELLSDSEPDLDHPDSDLEVIEALQRTSRSSSTIPPSDANNPRDADSDLGEPETSFPSDTDNYDGSYDLQESDTVWQDDGTSGTSLNNDSWDWSGGGARASA